MNAADQSADRYNRWWDCTRADAHRTVQGLVNTIKGRQSSKRKIDLLHAKIYANHDVAGTGMTAATAYELLRGEDGRMRYQLCTAIVDTAVAVITSNKPVPYYLTEGAEWTEQRKAKRKAKLIAGQFVDLDVHSLAQRCARDALVYGTGIMHGYVGDDGKVCVERVLPSEIVIDPYEAAAGLPRSMYRVRMVAKEQLASLYKGKAGAIRTSDGPTLQDWEDRHLKRDGTLDMVMVYEAWHLPSKPGADDGRRIMCTSHTTLVDEKWEHDWFPFAVMRWKDRLTGWWGCGLVEETKAAQLRINKLIKRVEKLQDLGSNVWAFVPKTSGIQEHEITNQPLQILPVNGGQESMPVFYKHDATPPDLRSEIAYIRDETFNQVGLSQAQLQGEKPKGLQSAVAIRTAEDIGSRRHIENVRQYERFFIEIAKLLERLNDVAADEAEENGEIYYVTSLETRGRSEMIRAVKWTDVQSETPTTIRMFPVSALGSTPAGKMESVQELVQGGYLSRPYAMKLLDFPDLDAAMSLELVDIDLAQWQLERIQDGERGVLPLPQQNLEMAFEESRKVILQAELMEASDAVKRELRKYRDVVEKLIKKATQPPPVQDGAMQVGMTAPMGAPEQAGQVPTMAPQLAA